MDNGVTSSGAPPHVLAQMRGIPEPQGPFYPQAPPAPQGFDAGTVWDGRYNLRPYVDASGEIPPPTQERIDRFQRDVARLLIELEQADRDAAAAQEKANTEEDAFSVEAAMKEVEEAIAEKDRVVGLMKDHVADLCKGNPTRKQLEKLPEYVFRAFNDYIGRLINPEA